MLSVNYSRAHSHLESTSEFKLKTLFLVKILSLERLGDTEGQRAETAQPAHTKTNRVTQIIGVKTKTLSTRSVHKIGTKTRAIRIKYVSCVKKEGPVEAMLKMFDQLGTPENLKVKKAFPNASDHVITSYLSGDNYDKVTKLEKLRQQWL